MSDVDDGQFQAEWTEFFASRRDVALHLGIEPVARRPGEVVLRLPHHPDIQQPAGMFSAASLFGLADIAATFLAKQHTRGGQFPVAVQSSMNVLGNTDHGDAIATASLVKVGGTLIVTTTNVSASSGKELAVVQGTYLNPR